MTSLILRRVSPRAFAGRLGHPVAIGTMGTGFVGLAIVLAAWAFMIGDWELGRTITFSVAGILPITDTAGYYGCANGLLDMGHFAESYAGWCDHRPVYLGMLASLLALAGRYLHIALLLQAVLVSAALAVLAREILRLAGVLGTILAIAVLWAFAVKTCFLTTATENAGLALGTLALALLLRGAEQESRRIVFAGIALLSIALNARAGALLALPLLVLWSGVFAWQAGYGIWRTMAGAVVAVAIGFFLEYLLVVITGAAIGAAHSNFAYTLYGLAVGGKSWTQVGIDHPEIALLPTDAAQSQAIYRLAFAAIRDQPQRIILALAENFATNLLDTATFGIGTRFGQGARWAPLAIVAAIPWLAGITAIIARPRDLRLTLLGTIVLGGLLSGAIIVQDGGVRVYAATIAGDAVIAGVGIAMILRRVAGTRSPAPAPAITLLAPASPAMALGSASLLLVLTIVPFTPLLQAMALPPLVGAAGAGSGCAAGETSYLVRLGRDSVVLAVTPDGEASLYPPRYPEAQFRRAFDQNFWFAPPFRHAPPVSYVLAYQREADAPDRGATHDLAWFGDLTPLNGRIVRLCATQDGALSVWGFSYDIVTSVTPLPTQP